MRILHLFCIVFFLTGTAFAAPDTSFDTVFDLDWTIAYKTTAEKAARDPRGIFYFENEYYRVPPQTIEALRQLHSTPGIRVSYISGGTAERNQALLQSIYSAINSNSPSEVFSPHMVLSKNDLVANEQALPTDPFSVRFKKNLLAINPDLRRIILVDDIKNFLLPGQEANMLWTGTTFEDFLNYQEAKQKIHSASEADKKYFPTTEQEYINERNKILRFVHLILKAFDRSPANPVELLNSWTRSRDGQILDLTRGGLRCEALF